MGVVLESLQLVTYLLYTYFDACIRLIIRKKPRSVAGKVVLVTGAGHGIGKEIALQFSALGATLVLWDINQTNNEAVAVEIRERGGSATAYTCDIGKISAVKEIAAVVRREIGDVDIVVNNAAILNGGTLLEMSEKDIKRTMDVNIMAQFWILREFLPSMIEKNSGIVINMSSMAGKYGSAYVTDYCASKFAVIGLTEALVDEMNREGHKGIDFTYVCPMLVDTGLVKYWYDRFGTITSPQKVAKAAIDGALTGEMVVTVPSFLGLQLRIPALLPRKFLYRLRTFAGVGMHPQYKRESNGLANYQL